MLSTAGMDYTAVSQTVIFAPGQTTAGVTISLIDNDEISPQPSISFSVSLIPNPSVIILGENPVVTIIDYDGESHNVCLYVIAISEYICIVFIRVTFTPTAKYHSC